MRTLLFTFSFVFLVMMACSGSKNNSADFSGTMTTESLAAAVGQTKTVEAGAFITLTGSNETVDGTLSFRGGATLVFEGDATLNGSFALAEGSTNSDPIVIVANGNMSIGQNFNYTALNSLQIVSQLADALTDDQIIADAAMDDGVGNIVGNMPLSSTVSNAPIQQKVASKLSQAQGRRCSWRVSGNYAPKCTRTCTFLFFPRNCDVEFVQVNIKVPDAPPGKSETKEGTATGGDAGQKAPSLLVKVPEGRFTADKFTVELGYGGKGGDATAIPTQTLCDTTATGGKGGPSGNLKITALGEIIIKSMTIIPGISGDGGNAIATGCDRPLCVGKGGNATATGGVGADNQKTLKTRGVTGLANVTIHDVLGGDGGDATAVGGKGSDNEPVGSVGGTATATEGKGGKASVTADIPTNAIDGKDGTKTATNGAQGASIICKTSAGANPNTDAFVAGGYAGGNGSCGLTSTTVSISGSSVTFTPFGSGVASQSFIIGSASNTASANGVTVLGQGNHTVNISINGSNITVNATNNTTGGACSETLIKQ